MWHIVYNLKECVNKLYKKNFGVLNCSPTLIGATKLVAPIRVGLQKQESVDVL